MTANIAATIFFKIKILKLFMVSFLRSRYKIAITFLTILLRLLMPVTTFQYYGYF